MKHMITIVMVFVLSSMLLVAGCSSNDRFAQETSGSESGEVSFQAAPAFEVQTTQGRTVSTQEYQSEGKPMIVYFMASTCSTCAKNWKNIDEVYPEYKGKVDLVAISVDPTDDKEVLEKLAQEKGFTFETVPGNPQLAVQYDVKKQTAKFVIDKDGNIVSRHDGLLSAQEWKELFESVL